jgi:DNA-binding HxlR family transcriptional regulator
MTADTFHALQQVLERLGDPALRTPESANGVVARHVVPQHGLELEYAWDERSRTLTLLGLARVPDAP